MPEKKPLRAPNPRLSKSHKIVLACILALGEGRHATMAEIYEDARKRQPELGFSTVYRALKRLREAGLILELSVPDTPGSTYEPVAPPHAHHICSKCGRVQDISFTVETAKWKKATAKAKVSVDDMAVVFRGLCQQCK